ncbi:Nn.00g021380.m01.CDS01 [Neocucurbitaria sp. VM-36]
MASNKLTLKQPKGRELLGGDLLAQCLHQLGVRTIFGLHGGHLDAFLMGCTDLDMELIDTRHETVAVQAAEGYAKVSGKTGCCFVTANSGIVSLAWRATTAGAPGPVLLDFPIDVLFTPVDEIERVAWGNITGPPFTLPGPDPNAIKELVSLIKTAERPAIIVGTGARNAVDEITTLASAISLPIFHSPKFSTGIPVTHPLHAGSALQLAILGATQKPHPDLVILLGARTGFLLGGRGGAVVPISNCKIVQVDVDGSEIGRSEHVDLGIVSDIKLALAALNSEVQSAEKFQVPESWVQTALSLKSWRAPHNESEPKIDEKNGHLHPYHAVKALYQSTPKGSVICIDGGEAGGWALQLLPEASASLAMVTTGYLGFLGNGWGYSLGAAVADRSKLVVNIQGDGSAGFHLAELDTYKKFNLRILTVIVNNSAWGMSQAGQEMIYGHLTSAKPASALRAETRYDIVAQGFGMPGLLIDATASLPEKKCLDGLGSAVDEIVKSGGPGLIDLRVSPHPYQDSTKAMVGATKDPDVIVVPYYDNLPRPYYKTKVNGST